MRAPLILTGHNPFVDGPGILPEPDRGSVAQYGAIWGSAGGWSERMIG